MLMRLALAVQEMHNEIQDVLGQSFAVPDGLDEDDLLEELDALEHEMANELESGSRAGVPSYLQVITFCSFLPCLAVQLASMTLTC